MADQGSKATHLWMTTVLSFSSTPNRTFVIKIPAFPRSILLVRGCRDDLVQVLCDIDTFYIGDLLLQLLSRYQIITVAQGQARRGCVPFDVLA